MYEVQDYLCCSSSYTNGGILNNHMWKSAGGPHHFDKRGGLRPQHQFNTQRFNEVHVPSQAIEWSCIGASGVDFASVSRMDLKLF